ncbi:MAG: Gfo/Idh/MocA family oxidoreductase [Terrimicrobiaceae bacterium]|nr:Gfo/Idh/MocA family oxidoreductase [Terrimicrobiaceae bacterium]
MKRFRVGLAGCGAISHAYAKGAAHFPNFEIAACADLDASKAEALAREYNIPKACPVEDLIASPGLDIILNLTIPSAHASLAMAALRAGKHVYNEKPLAIRRREAREMMGLARDKGLRIGCAPDTFLGAGLQTCRRLLDEGAIGKPLAATACFMSRGPEVWHPSPDFFYQKGGGPLFDMGPYYLTALVSLLGPVRRVAGSAAIGIAERIAGAASTAPSRKIQVQTPTHIAATLDFLGGAIATFSASFEVGAHHCPMLEIYGEEGSLSLPDPNAFLGPVRLSARESWQWKEVPVEPSQTGQCRGLGLSEMCQAIQEGREHRASDRLAYHVLDIMHSVLDSSEAGRHVELRSGAPRPAPMPQTPPRPQAPE